MSSKLSGSTKSMLSSLSGDLTGKKQSLVSDEDGFQPENDPKISSGKTRRNMADFVKSCMPEKDSFDLTPAS